MDRDGAVVARRRVATPQGNYRETLGRIAQLVAELELSSTDPATVGIATPGAISQLTGRMKNCNSTCLNDRPLLQDLENKLKRKVRIANDADCFTLSEATDGAGRGFERVFGVILGTGVGGGICQQRRLLIGPNSIAGEWGHNPMPPLCPDRYPDGVPERWCYCGRRNCVETYLSGPGLEQSYADLGGRKKSVIAIVEAADGGEELALQVLDRYQECLASALGTVINLLDPHVIVLGGGLSNIASLYREIPRRWDEYVFSDRCDTLLMAPKYGDASGVRGAAWLC